MRDVKRDVKIGKQASKQASNKNRFIQFHHTHTFVVGAILEIDKEEKRREKKNRLLILWYTREEVVKVDIKHKRSLYEPPS